jgi:hypothetical protein
LHVRFICRSPFPAGETQTSMDNLAQALIDGACRVWWLKGGIMLEPDSTSVIPDANVPATVTVDVNESMIPSGQTTRTRDDPNAVEIYLVESLVGNDFLSPPKPRRSGGVTYGCGTAGAYVILEIRKAKNNPYLLAHEIGHVLGIAHPSSVEGQSDSCALSTNRQGSECSVMIPDRPASPRNTTKNVNLASTFPLGNVFEKISGASRACNPDPDLGDPLLTQEFFHIVRDFPSDDGTQNSVPTPPASVWWTHSDVWVSGHDMAGNPIAPAPAPNLDELYSDNTPMFNDDRSPRHSQPVRSLTNEFCVRVHTFQEMPQPANVHLFLANPGASSQHLSRLTPAAGLPFSNVGVDRITPGRPFTKSISVNPSQLTGFPAHSCVFAVVLSTNSPDPTLTSIVNNPNSTFASLANFVISDNDVAQRNLNIQLTASGRRISLPRMLPWVELANILDRPARASVEIDTSQSKDLQGLVLELNDKNWGNIEVGGTTRVTLADALPPGDHMILRLRATLPPDQPMNASFPIHLRLLIEDQFLSGYTYMLRIAPLPAVIFQMLDSLYGALSDVAAGCKEKQAQVLADSIRRAALIERQQSFSSGCFAWLWSILRPKNAWRSGLLRLSTGMTALVQNLETRNEPEIRAVGMRLSQLGELLNKDQALDDISFIEQVSEHADYIQALAGRLAQNA